jgi:hypothetical protein
MLLPVRTHSHVRCKKIEFFDFVNYAFIGAEAYAPINKVFLLPTLYAYAPVKKSKILANKIKKSEIFVQWT